MASYFLDSSAVVKRYISEPGTAWVVGVSDPAAHNDLFVASVTAIELVSAITRRRNAGTIDPATATAALSQIRYDFANQYQTVEISDTVVARAVALAESRGLRAYDAVQLAAMLETSELRSGLPVPALTLVCADQELNAAARSEGVAIEDPNSHV